ncbi:hypothetical protein AAFF_G00262150 [Aldrovandia affinis]|uniref:Uncharacterized protein n=1 Tax=Aldrovandia affinis TaxID=143900 RepID=A0AAD7SSF1_9TELE|nr:hypothetical protein AAFF_G00262150 [Aldrovandia affinis]
MRTPHPCQRAVFVPRSHCNPGLRITNVTWAQSHDTGSPSRVTFPEGAHPLPNTGPSVPARSGGPEGLAWAGPQRLSQRPFPPFAVFQSVTIIPDPVPLTMFVSAWLTHGD